MAQDQLQSSFRWGEIYPEEEGQELELKGVNAADPAGAISNAADEYAVAFLNTRGGRILWGIRDADRQIVGVALNATQRDEVQRRVVAKLQGIEPRLDPTRFQ